MSMKVVPFRLDHVKIAIIDRWAEGLAKKTGRTVTRSQAVRFIIEGFRRAELNLPEIGDEALLDLVSKEPFHG